MVPIVLGSKSIPLKAQSFGAQSAETLSQCANWLKSCFWKAQENFQYSLLPLQPGHLGQERDKHTEVFKRVFLTPTCAIGSLVLAPFAVLGHGLTGLSNALKTREFVYLEGNGIEKETFKPKIMHLNACMFAGGLPYLFGGVRPAGDRMDELVSLIEGIDPDIFFLCEFSETLTSRLFDKLKGKYRHFFMNIGSNAKGMDASKCVVSRLPIVSEPKFIPAGIEPEGDQKYSYRGYFIVETENCRYLYTHFHPKDTDRAHEIRVEQLSEIEGIIEKEGGDKPWVVLGDINIDRNNKTYSAIQEKGFVDEIQNQHGYIATCANGLENGSIRKEESLDYFLTVLDKPISMTTEVIDTYNNPQKALSDHKAIVATLDFSELE